MAIERETRGISARRRLISAAIVVAIPIVLWNVVPPEGLSAAGWRIAILLAAAAVGLLLRPIPALPGARRLAAPEPATALVPPATAFGVFAAAALLLLLGAHTLIAAQA